MAMTERSRAAPFRGLSDLLDDEEAVGEMLSYFPARDAEEWASKAYIDARLSEVESRLTGRIHAEIGGLRSELRAGIGSLQSEIRTMTRWAIGAMVSLAALLVALRIVVP